MNASSGIELHRISVRQNPTEGKDGLTSSHQMYLSEEVHATVPPVTPLTREYTVDTRQETSTVYGEEDSPPVRQLSANLVGSKPYFEAEVSICCIMSKRSTTAIPLLSYFSLIVRPVVKPSPKVCSLSASGVETEGMPGARTPRMGTVQMRNLVPPAYNREHRGRKGVI